MNSNQNIQSYNNFLEMPLIPHKIIEYLFASETEVAEMIWKLLKYNDIDCLNKPNLTQSEKAELRWTGSSKQETFKLFIKPTISDSLVNSDMQNILKIYRLRTTPNNNLSATIDVRFELITNENSSIVKYNGVYCERLDVLEACILSLFNGKDIGVGIMEFSLQNSRLSQSNLALGDNVNFYGRYLVFNLLYTRIDRGGKCG